MDFDKFSRKAMADARNTYPISKSVEALRKLNRQLREHDIDKTESTNLSYGVCNGSHTTKGGELKLGEIGITFKYAGLDNQILVVIKGVSASLACYRMYKGADGKPVFVEAHSECLSSKNDGRYSEASTECRSNLYATTLEYFTATGLTTCNVDKQLDRYAFSLNLRVEKVREVLRAHNLNPEA